MSTGKPDAFWSQSVLAWWIYALGLAAAEITVAYGSLVFGLLLHELLLVAMLVHASYTLRLGQHRFYLALTVAPLIRILSLTIPMVFVPLALTFLVTGVAVLAAAVTVIRTCGFSRDEIGLEWGNWRVQLLVALSGIPIGIAEYYLLRPEPLVSSLQLGEVLLPALVLLIYTGFLEELVFRGVMLRAACAHTSQGYALLYVNIVFAVMHITHLVPLDVLFVFLVGIWFTVLVLRTRSLVGVTVAHGLANVVLYLIWPFLA